MSTTLLTSHHDDIEQGTIDRSSDEIDRSSDDDIASSCAESCTIDNDENTPKGHKLRTCNSSSSSSCYLSECSVEDTVERGKESVHLSKVERDCRICHLSLDGLDLEYGLPIELGCSCKEDLAAAHKNCAETWFKIRGNKICEICGSTARNVVGVNEVELTEQWNEANETTATPAAVPPHPAETRHFWQGHRFLNFLLACMVFAFVISWLFHFNVPS